MMPHLFTTTAINSKKPTSKEARVGQLRYRRKGIGACPTHASSLPKASWLRSSRNREPRPRSRTCHSPRLFEPLKRLAIAALSDPLHVHAVVSAATLCYTAFYTVFEAGRGAAIQLGDELDGLESSFGS